MPTIAKISAIFRNPRTAASHSITLKDISSHTNTITRNTQRVISADLGFKLMEKNFAKYDQYRAYFEANRQDYPRFIEKDDSFKIVDDNYSPKHKF